MTFWFDDPTVLFNKSNILSLWPLKEQDLNQKLNSITRLIIVLTLIGYIFTKNIKILITSVITLIVLVILQKNRSPTLIKKKINRINLGKHKKEGFENEKWNSKVDKNSGKTYYINKITGETSWEKPEDFKPKMKKEDKKDIKEQFVQPSKSNPLMNVLLTDIKDTPQRKDAAPSFNKDIKKKIDKHAKNNGIDQKIYLDLGDNISYEKNMKHDISMQRFYTTANSRVANDQTAFAKFCYGNMPSCKDGDAIQCDKNNERWINY